MAGSKVGLVLQVNFRSKKKVWPAQYIRVRVLVDTLSPLRPGFFEPHEGTEPLWVRFHYERISEFCFNCGPLDTLQSFALSVWRNEWALIVMDNHARGVDRLSYFHWSKRIIAESPLDEYQCGYRATSDWKSFRSPVAGSRSAKQYPGDTWRGNNSGGCKGDQNYLGDCYPLSVLLMIRPLLFGTRELREWIAKRTDKAHGCTIGTQL